MHLPLRLAALALLLTVAACTKPSPIARTQTNEEGCTRIRSMGPQNPFADPVPIKQACVGPYLLAYPQNYYQSQVGTHYDGSFALALEFPSLQPFKPGENARPTLDLRARSVFLQYSFVSTISVQQALKNSYTPFEFEKLDPAESLDGRTLGAPAFGLTPYYADIERIRTYHRSRGSADAAPIMSADWHVDWFVTRDGSGTINRMIKCTSREVKKSGLAMRDGKIVRAKGFGFPVCDHQYMVPELNVIADIHYARDMLEQWQQMEDQSRLLLEQGRARAALESEVK